MKILKNILIGLGVFFVVIIALFVYLGLDSSEFKEKQTPFIESFMEEFSANWELQDVYSKLTNDLIKQIDTPNGRQAMSVFRGLGSYEGMSDLAVNNYSSATSGKTATFTFKAQFSSGPALVQIVLLEADGKTLVNGLHITPSNNTPAQNTKHEA